MKGAMAPHHREDKHCVSQADIDRGFEKLDQMPGQCSQKVTSATATTREGTFQCAGANTASGTYSFRASSPKSIVATWNMTRRDGGNTMTMKSNMKGKWLGADCGDAAH